MTDRKLTKTGDTVGTPNDAEFEHQIKVAESILRRYRNAFRELAK